MGGTSDRQIKSSLLLCIFTFLSDTLVIECKTVYFNIEVNNNNYRYLQLFDLIENKDNIDIEVENPDKIIYNFIAENELDFEKIIKYAMDTKSRTVINKILVLAR